MLTLRITLNVLLIVIASIGNSSGQTHFKFLSNTGNNATVGIRASVNPIIDGDLLTAGDEIAVFADGLVTPDSFCVGAIVWNDSNLAITVWGDNDQTPILDGIRPGTVIRFRIWRQKTNTEYRHIKAAYSQGDGIYVPNGIFVVASLVKQPHFTFTSITGNNATIGVPDSTSFMIAGNHISVGDEIGVFADGMITPDSFCVGAEVWTGKSTVITVWGDNSMTASLDGIRVGTPMRFRIWRNANDREYRNATATYSLGNGLYAVDGIYVLSSLLATPVNENKQAPEEYVLYQNYPNPFNPSTTIEYSLPKPTHVQLKVYDILGHEIQVIVTRNQSSGRHQVRFDSRGLSAGVYLYRLQAGDFCATRKLLVVR